MSDYIRQAALARHGYDVTARPSGVSGRGPASWPGFSGVLLREHVCYLDGIEIDGHEPSDLDPLGACLHCNTELFPWIDPDDDTPAEVDVLDAAGHVIDEQCAVTPSGIVTITRGLDTATAETLRWTDESGTVRYLPADVDRLRP